MSERITMKGVAECCEMFRANLVPMTPNKFWNNVAHGEYDGWAICALMHWTFTWAAGTAAWIALLLIGSFGSSKK